MVHLSTAHAPLSPSIVLPLPMAPSLYAADAFVGTPKKIDEKATDSKAGAAAAPAENGGRAPKPKRVVSEETKAKLREAQQRRKQERLEAERAKNEQEESARREHEASAAAAQAKKEAAAQKRREARLKRKQAASEEGEEEEDAGSAASSGSTTPGSHGKTQAKAKAKATPPAPVNDQVSPGPASDDGQANQAVQAPPAKKQRKEGNRPKAAPVTKKPKDGDAPPPWFNKFVGAMMQEKNEQQGIRVNKKHLKEAATQEAENRWRDGYTRERVRATVDDHVSRMYGMIFG